MSLNAQVEPMKAMIAFSVWKVSSQLRFVSLASKWNDVFVLEQRKTWGFNAGFQKSRLDTSNCPKMSRPAAIDKRPGGILIDVLRNWETLRLHSEFQVIQLDVPKYRGCFFLHVCDMIFHLPKKKAESLTKYSLTFGVFFVGRISCVESILGWRIPI